ncbi:hypothetical protein Mgra_00004318 [Meloidogyne graminicola]|uniref:Uncharacterized protein n=1 Tax=Meloidogyne graminicola TaxID=189291 RepID=A0A8S9ZSI0_9BILA|nr:hypothetical protein Mgra_00004318 [Meloidogyne graminicola]
MEKFSSKLDERQNPFVQMIKKIQFLQNELQLPKIEVSKKLGDRRIDFRTEYNRHGWPISGRCSWEVVPNPGILRRSLEPLQCALTDATARKSLSHIIERT